MHEDLESDCNDKTCEDVRTPSEKRQKVEWHQVGLWHSSC